MEEQIIEAFNNGKGFMVDNGFKVTKLTDKVAIMEAKIKDNFLNPYGIVHGGILFGMADSVSGALACMSGKSPVTTSASMNYLNACKGTKIIAEATVLKLGKNIGYYNVNVYDDKKTLVAQANVNMYLLDNSK